MCSDRVDPGACGYFGNQSLVLSGLSCQNHNYYLLARTLGACRVARVVSGDVCQNGSTNLALVLGPRVSAVKPQSAMWNKVIKSGDFQAAYISGVELLPLRFAYSGDMIEYMCIYTYEYIFNNPPTSEVGLSL